MRTTTKDNLPSLLGAFCATSINIDIDPPPEPPPDPGVRG
jgi:hypothetical protein